MDVTRGTKGEVSKPEVWHSATSGLVSIGAALSILATRSTNNGCYEGTNEQYDSVYDRSTATSPGEKDLKEPLCGGEELPPGRRARGSARARQKGGVAMTAR